ncbi:MAG: hypothetical protein N2C14_31955, partial [Planctomycetales bacterium]
MEKVNVTIHEALRYGYGGFAFVIVATLINKTDVNNLKDLLGFGLSAAMVLVLGAFLAAVYRWTYAWLVEGVVWVIGLCA